MIRRPRVAAARLGLCLVACNAFSPVIAWGQTPPKEKPLAPPVAPVRGKIPREEMIKPWTGDFDGMAKRRIIRVLTP